MPANDDQTSFIREQLAIYSNAIVAFSVLQSITYSYFFGTNCNFNITVKTANLLAEGLTLLFLLVGGLAIGGMFYIGRTMKTLVPSHQPVVTSIYRVKVVLVSLFSLLPLIVTFAYAVMSEQPTQACLQAGSDGLEASIF